MFGIVLGAIGVIAKAVCTIGLAVQGLKAIVSLVTNIAKALGITDEPKPEMAEKALQAEEDGIYPENFDTYDEYLNEIENYEIDPEKKHTEEELLQKEVVIISGMILEKNKDLEGPIVQMIDLVAAKPSYYNEARMSEIGRVCGNDPEKFSELVGMINNTEKNIEKFNRGEKTIIEIEKRLDPSLNDSQALQRFVQNK